MPPLPDDDRSPEERFRDFGSKLFSTPKAVIDERDKAWQRKQAVAKRKRARKIKPK